mgnify:CR=1 FL=1
MHIGCCENCKYVDLVENVTGVCPRCGGIIESLGIESASWNRMPDDEKSVVISSWFEDEVLGGDTGGDQTQSNDKRRIYVCYKCGRFAVHHALQEKYYCRECGADMLDVGYSTSKWDNLTRYEQQKIAEKVRKECMDSRIRNISDSMERLNNQILQ